MSPIMIILAISCFLMFAIRLSPHFGTRKEEKKDAEDTDHEVPT